MRTKINLLTTNNYESAGNEIVLNAELENAFNYLLSAKGLDQDKVFYESASCTIQEFAAEMKLMDHSIFSLVGYRGTGKTAFVLNALNVNGKECVSINKDNIVLYFSLEKCFMKNCFDEMLDNNLEIVLNALENRALEYKTDKPFFENKSIKLKNLKNDNDGLIVKQSIYKKLYEIKSALIHKIPEIKRMYIVLDNIELKKDYLPEVESVIKIHSYMSDYDSDVYPDRFYVKTIVPMQVKTYRDLMRRGGNYHLLHQAVIKDYHIDLSNLFEHRYETAKKCLLKNEKMTFSLNDLEHAQEILIQLITKYNGKYLKMVLNLQFYDIHRVLEMLKKIVLNHTWVQKNGYCYDKNIFEKNPGFMFTNITCIRAIACGNKTVYSSSMSIIPNILYNTQTEEFGIYILLVMKYFLKRYEAEDLFGNNGIEYGELLNELSMIFIDNDIVQKFKIAIRYMKSEQREILRSSICVKGKEKLYITTRGAELWDMIRSDSVYLELCREDYYREYENTLNNSKKSYDLVSSGDQDHIFLDVMKIVIDINIQENELFEVANHNGMREQYFKALRKKRITYYLMEGISKSIMYSRSGGYDVVKKEKFALEQKINEPR